MQRQQAAAATAAALSASCAPAPLNSGGASRKRLRARVRPRARMHAAMRRPSEPRPPPRPRSLPDGTARGNRSTGSAPPPSSLSLGQPWLTVCVDNVVAQYGVVGVVARHTSVADAVACGEGGRATQTRRGGGAASALRQAPAPLGRVQRD